MESRVLREGQSLPAIETSPFGEGGSMPAIESHVSWEGRSLPEAETCKSDGGWSSATIETYVLCEGWNLLAIDTNFSSIKVRQPSRTMNARRCNFVLLLTCLCCSKRSTTNMPAQGLLLELGAWTSAPPKMAS